MTISGRGGPSHVESEHGQKPALAKRWKRCLAPLKMPGARHQSPDDGRCVDVASRGSCAADQVEVQRVRAFCEIGVLERCASREAKVPRVLAAGPAPDLSLVAR